MSPLAQLGRAREMDRKLDRHGLTRLRTALVGAAVAAVCFLVLGLTLLVIDLWFHRKFDPTAGVNYRGYRGTVLGRKLPDERRVGLFGGSVAMGYGVKNEVSIAGLLERALNDRPDGRARYRVVNLAMNAEPSISYFKANYELFQYLDLDTLLFYVCGEDLSSLPHGAPVPEWAWSQRSANPVLRTFGYYFVFPVIVREKYYLLRFGSVARGYREDRAFAWFDRLSDERRRQAPAAGSLQGFITQVTGADKRVVLAFCPEGSDVRTRYDELLRKPLAGIPGVAVVDLAGLFGNPPQSSYLIDEMHYSEAGNRLVAEALVDHVRP